MCHDNCNFSLWSPVDDGGFAEDRAFSCYAQAISGDFTVGRDKLNDFCKILADGYRVGTFTLDDINNPELHSNISNACNFDFNSLLDEEVDYCIERLEWLLNG